MEKYTYTIKKDGLGQRIDHYLVKVFPKKQKASRTCIKKLINGGNVLLNGKETKPHHRLKPEDIISVEIPKTADKPGVVPENIRLDIVYEDNDIVVLNKPAGMVVHPGAGVRKGTVVNALAYHFESLSRVGGPLRPGVVHRLDKGTSGLLIVAKNDAAHRELARQFKERRVKRRYIAFAKGALELDSGRVELPIGRHPRSPKKMAVAFSKSKTAVTNYKVLERFGDYAMLEISPDTGRTHQIRVHMAYLDHPLVGDAQYGRPDRRIARHALHASRITFIHPRTDRRMEFEAPLPKDMKNLAG